MEEDEVVTAIIVTGIFLGFMYLLIGGATAVSIVDATERGDGPKFVYRWSRSVWFRILLVLSWPLIVAGFMVFIMLGLFVATFWALFDDLFRREAQTEEDER